MSGEIAVTRREAARRLSMSLSSFERYVQPHVDVVRPGGRLVLVPVSELEKWIARRKARTLKVEG